MAGEQKLFLKTVANSWRHEFPFLQPVHLREDPQIPRGCNYLCDAHGEGKKVYYFVRFDFSANRRGEFSIGITISQSRERSALSAGLVDKPNATSIGSFGIWQFMGKPRFNWALVDLEAESMAFFGFSTGLPKSPNVWEPTNYNQPLEKIVNEAIADVNRALRTYVFPTLQIKA